MSHILGILSSLFSNLPSESPARMRLLTKFVEGTYEKVDRLLEIREGAEARLKVAEQEIEQERNVCGVNLYSVHVTETAGLGFSHRRHRRRRGYLVSTAVGGWVVCFANSGLYPRLVMHGRRWCRYPFLNVYQLSQTTSQIRDHITMILGRKNKTLKDIVTVLKLYRENVGDDETRVPDDPAPSQQEILQGLIAFLEGC
jgi:beta-catenin-like protein 1